MPADLAEDHATFVFAGTFGYGSAPAEQGIRPGHQWQGNPFVRYALRRLWETRWQSADQQVELRSMPCVTRRTDIPWDCSTSKSRETG